MTEATLALAFAAGTLAAVNPCGFALLPAYLALFVSRGDPAALQAHPGAALRRAALATVAMTGGFVVVFGTLGLAIAPFALSVERWLPWATMAIGFVLLGLGARLLSGHEVVLALPKVRGRGDPTSSTAAMGCYGVSFALASLSCTIGPFLAVTTTAFRDDSLPGVVAVFLAYSLGMGSVVAALTLAVALSEEALVRRVRRALPYVARAGGALLIAAGAYAAYFGWYEIRVLRGGPVDDPIVERASAWQADLSRAIDNLTVSQVLGVVVGLGWLAWGLGRLAAGRAARRAAAQRI